MADLEYKALEPSEVSSLAQIHSDAFLHPLESTRKNILSTGPQNYRVVKAGNRVLGGLGILSMGQWFGGKALPMAGLKALAVDPAHRGKGVASFLLKKTLEEISQWKCPLSALYPSTLSFYRKAGYERAGSRIAYKLSPQKLDRQNRGLEVREISPREYSKIYGLYERKARETNGNLNRHPLVWEKILEPRDQQVRSYLLMEGETPQGYGVFSLEKRKSTLLIRDMTLMTREAAAGLIHFLSCHKTTVKRVIWYGSPQEPLLHILWDFWEQIKGHLLWMIRIVHLREALSQRGYPRHLSGEIHLEIEDSLFEWNRGKWILEVQDGEASVRPGGSGRIKMDIRTLGPIFTSYLSPSVLARLGEAQGEEDDLKLADLLFGGPSPWMNDFF